MKSELRQWLHFALILRAGEKKGLEEGERKPGGENRRVRNWVRLAEEGYCCCAAAASPWKIFSRAVPAAQWEQN